MSSSRGKLAVEALTRAKVAPAKNAKKREQQILELEEMVSSLEKGSSSLNQRATTLAALAVAALGAFGIFASRLDSIGNEVLQIVIAGLLVVTSLALLVAASFALWSVRPAGWWSENFADRAEDVMAGQMGERRRLDHLSRTAKVQLQRNNEKARRMKQAYDASAVALVAATSAVVTILLDSFLG